MAYFEANTQRMSDASAALSDVISRCNAIRAEIEGTARGFTSSDAAIVLACGKIAGQADALNGDILRIDSLRLSLASIAEAYSNSESKIIANASGNKSSSVEKANGYSAMSMKVGNCKSLKASASGSKNSGKKSGKKSFFDKLLKELRKKINIGTFKKISKDPVSSLLGLFQDLHDADTWSDFAKIAITGTAFAFSTAKKIGGYERISRITGAKTATEWYLKSAFGVRKLERLSTEHTFLKKFKKNLTNKTSPFKIGNIFKDFTGANGAGKAVAAWTGVAITGVINYFDNKDEQAKSNGTMSDGRVVAETISETAIGTVVSYVSYAVVGAAVGAVLGSAAPAIAVTVLSGAIIIGAEATFKAATGTTFTEWASDSILDLMHVT